MKSFVGTDGREKIPWIDRALFTKHLLDASAPSVCHVDIVVKAGALYRSNGVPVATAMVMVCSFRVSPAHPELQIPLSVQYT
jgi:hypothetical protein